MERGGKVRMDYVYERGEREGEKSGRMNERGKGRRRKKGESACMRQEREERFRGVAQKNRGNEKQ